MENKIKNLLFEVINARKEWKYHNNSLWLDPSFHYSNRIVDIDDLYNAISLVIEHTIKEGNETQIRKAKKAKEVLENLYRKAKDKEDKFSPSLMPFNLAIAWENKDPSLLLKYFPRVELYQDDYSKDPYALFKESSLIKVDINGREIPIASRTFDYAVLFNTTYSCPIGCSGCYKGSLVRVKSQEGILRLLKKESKALSIEKKVDYLVEWLNKHGKNVDTMVISGGEPFLFPPNSLKYVLKKLGEVPSLKYIRICTSSIFQGMFFAFNEEMLSMLKEITEEYEKKGKALIFNVHATNSTQLSAEESKIVMEKLLSAGVKGFYIQMPLQQNVNFWREDIELSFEEMRKSMDASLEVPALHLYKLIVDMHSPVSPNITVPIESVLKLLDKFESHTQTSDLERWQAVNILSPFGNAYLNATLSTKVFKEIKEEEVLYYIVSPKVITIYKEPKIEGVNDKQSFPSIEYGIELNPKLKEFRELYFKYEKTKDPAVMEKLLRMARKRPINPVLYKDEMKEKAREFSRLKLLNKSRELKKTTSEKLGKYKK